MIKLTAEQNALHQQALSLSRRHRKLESEIVEVLQKVDACKLFRKLDKPSLFVYTVETLGFSEAVAYSFITVSRKAQIVPELKAAIASESLSVSKAARIVSTINAENAAELIEFAAGHSSREIDQEMARRNPRAASPDKVRPISAENVQLMVNLTQETLTLLKRAQSLAAQNGSSTEYGAVLGQVLDFYLERRDPVRKAKRAEARAQARAREAGRHAPHSHPATNPDAQLC